MSVPKCISLLNDSVRVMVLAKPGARKSNVISIDDEAVGIQIAAPAREGAANEELMDYIGHVLGVKSRDITLGVGGKSRNKMLLVNTVQNKLTPESVFERIQSVMNDNKK